MAAGGPPRLSGPALRGAARAAATGAAAALAVPPLLKLTERLGMQPGDLGMAWGHEPPEVGRFVVGCAGLTGRVGLRPVSAPDSFAVLDAARDGGCLAFDTAAVYGDGLSERILGAWLRSRRLRDDVTILTKGGHPEAGGPARLGAHELAADLHASLRRLRTDRIDLYLLHRDDPTRAVGPIMECLHRFVQEGEVLAVGASNWTHTRIEAANQYARSRGLTPLTHSSPHLSLAEMHEPPWPGCHSLTGAQGATARAWYQATQMPVLAWSPLSGGYLTRGGPSDPNRASGYQSEANAARRRRLLLIAEERSATPEQVAIAYLLHLGLHVVPVIAASTPARLRELLAAVDLPLTPAELAWLEHGTTDRIASNGSAA